MPLRQLDNFTVVKSATLEAADLITAWTTTLAVLGTVKPATSSKAKSTQCFAYHFTVQACSAVVTKFM